MGVATTHYVVFGVVENDKQKVKDFFALCEKNLEFTDRYNDNGYREDISENKQDLHIIADGMSGEYVVIGRILYKSLEGFGFIHANDFKITSTEKRSIEIEIVKIDKKLATNFSNKEFELLIFTHFH